MYDLLLPPHINGLKKIKLLVSLTVSGFFPRTELSWITQIMNEVGTLRFKTLSRNLGENWKIKKQESHFYMTDKGLWRHVSRRFVITMNAFAFDNDDNRRKFDKIFKKFGICSTHWNKKSTVKFFNLFNCFNNY